MADSAAFARACQRRPFANGTEGDAWQEVWCEMCARDHEMHTDTGPGCSLLAMSYIDEWPEGWIPDPDDGESHLPSRLICTAFTPCEDCGGDDEAEGRAREVEFVVNYWRNRGAS